MRTLFALTLGAEGALLLDDGVEVARAAPPQVEAVDGTAAGDAFTACLVVSLLEGRERDEALRRACAAGALAASRLGAQPSLPDRSGGRRDTGARDDADPARLRPGPRRRDRASARAREPGARAARRHDRRRQPDARQDDRERPARARVRRRGDVPVAAGADRPLARELFIAAYVHGEIRPRRARAPRAAGHARSPSTPSTSSPSASSARRPVTLVPVGPLTNIALLLARHPEAAANVERIVLMGGAIAEGNVTPAAEFNI